MHNLRPALMLTFLAAGTVWTQDLPVPRAKVESAKPLRVIRILFNRSSGMCYGYCYAELEVEPGQARLRVQSWEQDKNKCPDLKVKADLSDKHWKELVQLIDREALLALQDRIGCPGCVDEAVESVEVQFSNHTKKAVEYNSGSPPREIENLSAKLAVLQENLHKELPPTTRCGM